MIFDDLGRSKLHTGPKRLWLWGGHTIQFIRKVVASSTQFLVITRVDGTKEHRIGPTFEWHNPTKFKSIEVNDVFQIYDNQAIVVYSEDTDKIVSRRVVRGPITFVPEANEWIGTFSWHGPYSDKDPGRHKAGSAKQTKLDLTPTNMPVDIKDVRSSDDCTLTVKMIMFFQLVDVDRMLNTTQDPTGDMINALSADVISRAAENTFEAFVENSPQLNSLETFTALAKRAPAIGFKLIKVVYLGYAGNATMRAMNDTAIITRTRQKLALEKRQQELLLADYTLSKKQALDEKRRTLTQINMEHDIKLKETAELSRRENNLKMAEAERAHTRTMHSERARKLELLKENGVDLTKYLVASQLAANHDSRDASGARSPSKVRVGVGAV